eukprot:GHVT01044388.1.p1 GENE.GHVT01044388.1~~GHVT01044388.1.p1  ORF type:complete len:1410 (+),score=144.97 GHVT01044388.1:1255-5484(+)
MPPLSFPVEGRHQTSRSMCSRWATDDSVYSPVKCSDRNAQDFGKCGSGVIFAGVSNSYSPCRSREEFTTSASYVSPRNSRGVGPSAEHTTPRFMCRRRNSTPGVSTHGWTNVQRGARDEHQAADCGDYPSLQYTRTHPENLCHGAASSKRPPIGVPPEFPLRYCGSGGSREPTPGPRKNLSRDAIANLDIDGHASVNVATRSGSPASYQAISSGLQSRQRVSSSPRSPTSSRCCSMLSELSHKTPASGSLTSAAVRGQRRSVGCVPGPMQVSRSASLPIVAASAAASKTAEVADLPQPATIPYPSGEKLSSRSSWPLSNISASPQSPKTTAATSPATYPCLCKIREVLMSAISAHEKRLGFSSFAAGTASTSVRKAVDKCAATQGEVAEIEVARKRKRLGYLGVYKHFQAEYLLFSDAFTGAIRLLTIDASAPERQTGYVKSARVFVTLVVVPAPLPTADCSSLRVGGGRWRRFPVGVECRAGSTAPCCAAVGHRGSWPSVIPMPLSLSSGFSRVLTPLLQRTLSCTSVRSGRGSPREEKAMPWAVDGPTCLSGKCHSPPVLERRATFHFPSLRFWSRNGATPSSRPSSAGVSSLRARVSQYFRLGRRGRSEVRSHLPTRALRSHTVHDTSPLAFLPTNFYSIAAPPTESFCTAQLELETATAPAHLPSTDTHAPRQGRPVSEDYKDATTNCRNEVVPVSTQCSPPPCKSAVDSISCVPACCGLCGQKASACYCDGGLKSHDCVPLVTTQTAATLRCAQRWFVQRAVTPAVAGMFRRAITLVAAGGPLEGVPQVCRPVAHSIGRVELVSVQGGRGVAGSSSDRVRGLTSSLAIFPCRCGDLRNLLYRPDCLPYRRDISNTPAKLLRVLEEVVRSVATLHACRVDTSSFSLTNSAHRARRASSAGVRQLEDADQTFRANAGSRTQGAQREARNSAPAMPHSRRMHSLPRGFKVERDSSTGRPYTHDEEPTEVSQPDANEVAQRHQKGRDSASLSLPSSQAATGLGSRQRLWPWTTRGLVHTDLKLENFLFDPRTVLPESVQARDSANASNTRSRSQSRRTSGTRSLRIVPTPTYDPLPTASRASWSGSPAPRSASVDMAYSLPQQYTHQQLHRRSLPAEARVPFGKSMTSLNSTSGKGAPYDGERAPLERQKSFKQADVADGLSLETDRPLRMLKGDSSTAVTFEYLIELTDFDGLVNEGMQMQGNATPGYVSPQMEEAHRTRNRHYHVSQADDAWALGEVLRRLCSVLIPPSHPQHSVLYVHQLWPVIRALKAHSQRERMTAQEARRHICHLRHRLCSPKARPATGAHTTTECSSQTAHFHLSHSVTRRTHHGAMTTRAAAAAGPCESAVYERSATPLAGKYPRTHTRPRPRNDDAAHLLNFRRSTREAERPLHCRLDATGTPNTHQPQ